MPFNPFPDLPLHWLEDGRCAVDDRAVDYVQLRTEAQARAETLAAETLLLTGLLPVDSPTCIAPAILDQGTPPLSLWITKVATNTFATLTVSNSTYGHFYLVLCKTNLNDPYWNSEFYFQAPTGPSTFTVPTTLPMKYFEAFEMGATNALVSIKRIDDAIEPPGVSARSGWFTVTRAHTQVLPEMTVCYAIAGTATPGSDYFTLPGSVTIPEGYESADVVVTPSEDTLIEWDETITLTLRPTNTYFLDPKFTSATVWLFDHSSVTQQFAKVFECQRPVEVDYNPFTSSLLVSCNWPNGDPRNFTNVLATGVGTPWTTIQGLSVNVCPELHFTTVKIEANNFVPGSMYFGIGPDQQQYTYTRIGYISRDASNFNLSWTTLTNATHQETCPVTGALYVDQTGLFEHDLIVVTGNGADQGGHVWRIKAQAGGTSAGSKTLFATIDGNPSLEGVVTLPNDPLKYGPLAGKLLTSSKYAEPDPVLFAIDTNGVIASFPLTIVFPEDLDLIPSDTNENCTQDLYCADTGRPYTELGNCIRVMRKEVLAGYGGDILITDAGERSGGGGSKLVVLHWDGTSSTFLRRTFFHPDGGENGLMEHANFAPISIPGLPQ